MPRHDGQSSLRKKKRRWKPSVRKKLAVKLGREK
jgi:hypothetical protein